MPTPADLIEETGVQPYSVCRLSAENIGHLSRLHEAVYNVRVPAGYFEKKYDTAFTGHQYVGFIAFGRGGIPVAFYGVIPCFIKDGDTIILAAQSADTMTHPQYRYKGMFVELSQLTFALCRKTGIRLLFGFPNQHSYHGAVHKLGWQMTEQMDCFLINLPLAGWKRRTGSLWYKAWKRLRKDRVGRRIAIFPNSSITDGFAGVLRDASFAGYKTYNPSFQVQAAGACFWVSLKGCLMIGDARHLDDRNFIPAMRTLERFASFRGIRQIQFHCSPGTNLHRLFRDRYPASLSYPVLFQDFGSPVRPDRIKFTFADIDIF